MPDPNGDMAQALMAIPKPGKTIPPQEVLGGLNALPGQFVGTVSDVLGINDAVRALRGDLSEGEAQDLAAQSAMGLLPLGKGAAAAKPLLGIFAGPASKTANLAKLAKAKEMFLENIGTWDWLKPDRWSGFPRELMRNIHDETGWWPSPVDAKWRYEIPDTGTFATDPNSKRFMSVGRASDLFKHPQLYESYPQLGEYNMGIGYAPERFGQNDSVHKLIEIFGPSQDVRTGVGLHEMQHGVQNIEDFPPGASFQVLRNLHLQPLAAKYGDVKHIPGEEYNAAIGAAHKSYRSVAGEVEARNVQGRFLDPLIGKGRPWLTADTPPAEQIAPSEWYNRQVPFTRHLISILTGGK